jgi:RimJ/RimL family protein N-acetyltransferase
MRVDPFRCELRDGRTCRIRSARPRDAGAILDHAWHIHTADALANAAEPDEMQLDAGPLRATLARLETADNGLFLLAEGESAIIATLSVEGGRFRRVRHTAQVGVSVGRDWRRQGLARTLLRTAVEVCRRSGVLRRLTLRVFAANRAALRLYLSEGFVEEGRLRDQVRLDDGYTDEICLALDLGGSAR